MRRHTRRGTVAVSKQELGQYYRSYHKARRNSWRGCDSNWALSFEKVKEAETTKHVHRLHPYKGKFIPQLVAYFLDEHTDRYKQEVYFHRGDTILDPFCGSGTTLVQANELGMHAIGIDISAFNTQISNVKLLTHDLDTLAMTIGALSEQLAIFVASSTVAVFEQELSSELTRFNQHRVKVFSLTGICYRLDGRLIFCSMPSTRLPTRQFVRCFRWSSVARCVPVEPRVMLILEL